MGESGTGGVAFDAYVLTFVCRVEEEEEESGGLLDEDVDEKNECRIAEANDDVLIVGDIVMGWFIRLPMMQ